MKKSVLTGLTALGLLLGSSTLASAAVPLSFTHHGLLWDGDELMNGQVNITATIYKSKSASAVAIKEVTKQVTVENGFYNLTIDDIDPEAIIAADGKMELGIKVGDGNEMTPRIAISSVPFAILAAHADSASTATTAETAGGLICDRCVGEELLSAELAQQLANSGNTSGDLVVANNSITTEMIQNGAVTKDKVNFNYAGSSSKGGSATSAVKLDTATAGTAAKPVYFTGGKPEVVTSIDSSLISGIKPANLDKTAMLDYLYPVGSIYISVSSNNPSTHLGGTWEQIKDRFMLAAGTTYAAGSTGGSATVSHTHTVTGTNSAVTLTSSHIPQHTHTFSGTAATITVTGGSHSHTIFANTNGSPDGQGDHNASTGPNRYWNGAKVQNQNGSVYSNPYSGSNTSNTKPLTDVSGSLSLSGSYTPKGTLSSYGSASPSSHTHTFSGTAASTSVSNMPPYLVVYVWKRTK